MNRDSFRAWRYRVRGFFNRLGGTRRISTEDLQRVVECIVAARALAGTSTQADQLDQSLRWLAHGMGAPLSSNADVLALLRENL